MKFKLDENLPAELADDLRELGHQAETVLDEGLGGASDPVVLEAAHTEGRVMLTLDKGIASLQDYPPENFSGIVLFRPEASGRGAVLRFIRERLPRRPGARPRRKARCGGAFPDSNSLRPLNAMVESAD